MALTDKDSEWALCGALLSPFTNIVFDDYKDLVSESDFSDEDCRKIWAIAIGIDAGGRSVRDNMLLELGKNKMMWALDRIIDLSNSPTNPVELALYIADMSSRRRILSAFSEKLGDLDDCTKPLPDICANLKQIVDSETAVGGSDVLTAKDVNAELLRDVADRMSGKKADGMAVGFAYIDRNNGFQPSDLNIIAGETSNGKTSLAISILRNSLSFGIPVLMYSMEMTAKQIMARMNAIQSAVGSKDILYKSLTEYGYNALSQACEFTSGLPLYIDGRSNGNISRIVSSMRIAVRGLGIRIVVIDYLQLLKGGNSRSRNLDIGEIVRELKNTAKELNICVVLLSQLARPAQGMSHFPTLNRLRDSGEIEEAADNIYFVYRAERSGEQYPNLSYNWAQYDTKGTALIVQAKGRNTGTGEFIVGFDAERTWFYDFTAELPPPIKTAAQASAQLNNNEYPF